MKTIALLFLFFISPVLLSSEPQIKHFFPDRVLLLGQPLFWMVELRHPIWESYDLKLVPCSGLKMSIADKTFSDVAGEIRVVYKLAVIPTALKTSCSPTIMISDEKGQTSVLNGKPLVVHRISGDSEEIKNPVLPALRHESSLYSLVLYILLALLALLCAVFAGKRVHAASPSQRFLRDVRKAILEVQKDKLPIQVWRLLRSELIWRFQAEPYTPAQLRQKAGQNRRLVEIANTLQSLEGWRYSGATAHWDRDLVKRGLVHAEALINTKRPILRRKAA